MSRRSWDDWPPPSKPRRVEGGIKAHSKRGEFAQRWWAKRWIAALERFDVLYPQPNNASALQQLQIQLAAPQPYDLDSVQLSEYKHLAPRWHDWNTVLAVCSQCAVQIFDYIAGGPAPAVQRQLREPTVKRSAVTSRQDEPESPEHETQECGYPDQSEARRAIQRE